LMWKEKKENKNKLLNNFTRSLRSSIIEL